MFDSLFRSPIEIRIHDQVIRFDSEADFAFAIEGRTDISGEESARLMALSPEALASEIARDREEDTLLRGHFEDALGSPERLDERLAQVAPVRWREEHQWNHLMAALSSIETPAHAVKRSAVLAYLGYLKSHVDVASAIAQSRLRSAGADAHTTLGTTAALGGNDSVASGDLKLARGQATLVLDSDELSVLVRFSQHPHRIVRVRGDGPRAPRKVELVDDAGRRWTVAPGLSCVGRDRSCDIPLRGVLRDISRAHAVFNLDEHGRLWITDTSSRGTFVVAAATPEPGDPP